MRAGYGLFFNGIFNVGDGANVGNNYPFAFGLNYTPANGSLPLSTDNSIGPIENGLLHVPLIAKPGQCLRAETERGSVQLPDSLY